MSPFVCIALWVVLTASEPDGMAPSIWEATLTFAGPAPRAVIVGETVSDVVIELRLTNHSPATQSHLPLKDACRAGVFQIYATPAGALRRELLMPIMYRGPDVLPTVAPGGHVAARFKLGAVGFTRLKSAGRLQLVGRYETSQGVIETSPLVLDVRDVPEPTDGAVKALLPTGYEVTRIPGEQSSVDIRRVRIGMETWLICVRRVGPRYGGSVEMTTRLAVVGDDTEFLVSGRFGPGEPIRVVYFTPTGVFKILSIHPTRLTLMDAE